MRVLVISADLFQDREMTEPVDALRKAGVDVDIASPLSGAITGKRGAYVEANLAVTDVDPDDYDLLLLPGGKAPQTLRESEAVLDVVATFAELGKPIAAICHGPQILISAGLVKKRTMTSYMSVGEELKAAGAQYVDEPLVRDGNFITSRNPNDLPRFIDSILETLGANRHAARVPRRHPGRRRAHRWGAIPQGPVDLL